MVLFIKTGKEGGSMALSHFTKASVPHLDVRHFISIPLRPINGKSLSQQARTVDGQFQVIKFSSSNTITNHFPHPDVLKNTKIGQKNNQTM
jgi:hypothetical protein